MTGGQPAEGGLTGVANRASGLGRGRRSGSPIVSSQPEKYPQQLSSPSGATIHHRRELDAVQKELRDVKGLSVLIYDQTCAA